MTPDEKAAAWDALQARIAKWVLAKLEYGACLACGAEPGCNIDCSLCTALSAPAPSLEPIIDELQRQDNRACHSCGHGPDEDHADGCRNGEIP